MSERDEGTRGPVIVPIKNGPLKVTGLTRLCNSRGDSIATTPTYILCRCGASKKKPFCDGTHVSIGFDDSLDPDRVSDRLDEYPGSKVTVSDNRGICSHAGFCTDNLPKVWRSGVEPWIDANGESVDEVVRVARMCPSGALSYATDGDRQTVFHDTPEVQVAKDGPYWVRGGVDVEEVDYGDGASREHCALCRCGQSRNKPFCDGSHWYAGFKDDEALTISASNRAEESTEEKWIQVGTVDGLTRGEVHSVTVGEKAIALVGTEDGWRAVDGLCPHQGGPLTEGTLCDGAIRCPWHGYDFSMATGKGIGNEHSVETYDARERDGAVEVAAAQATRSNWTVSHVTVETMLEWGVDTVFGMVGHSNLGLSEAMRVQEARGTLRYIGVRHEGAAAFACSGYGKVSGRPAACLSIAGPGATNLLTGLWDAKMDRVPVLALTGQINTQVMGPGAIQEIDLSSAFESVARFSHTVLPGSDHAELASLALKTAIVERDVSHLIFPDKVQTLDAGNEGPGRPDGRVGQTAVAPPPQPLAYALLRLSRARRPVIVVGHGARPGISEVVSLAETLRCPVITTFKAKGLIGDDHPLGAGVLGRSGTPVASWFMNQADPLVVFGASFAHHTGIDKSKPTIQVDFDRMALGKFHGVDEAVWGDIGITARLMREQLPDSRVAADQRSELAERWQAWRDEKATREKQDRGHGLNSALIFKHLAEAVPDDAVISVDVGNNTYSFGRYFETRRQTVVMSGYLGSIGFAFPAAMGAWAVRPNRPIVSVSGDGGFGQYMGEFLTAVKHGMNITHILLNNNELGKISKEQRDGEWKVWQTDLHNLRFADYANLCGGSGFRVERAADLPSALRDALAVNGPSLVEIVSDAMLT